MWLIIVTMTTVGYGDISPNTIGGRIVCMISCLGGVFLMGMIICSVTDIFDLEPHEKRILSILSKAENIEEKKKLASDVISQYIRILKTQVKGHNYNKIMNTFKIVSPLKKTVKKFNKEICKVITTNTEDFLAINNRLGFFVDLQKQLLNKRKKIYENLNKLIERIKKMKAERKI
jgi:ATP-dependent exoDNAse (exonuclease V) beta subunit